MANNKNPLTYESAQSELNDILDALQREIVSLDDVEANLRRATELIAFCQEKLRGLERTLQDFEQSTKELKN